MPPPDVPFPLVTCPGRSVWEHYRSKDYTVFIDESFYNFFNYSFEDGNFCYGAVGVPSDECAAFEQRLSPLMLAHLDFVKQVSGRRPSEFKHSDLYKLPYSFRRKFALCINGALKAHGGFIAGFYTSTKGFVMEKIREELGRTCTRVPDDHRELYSTMVTKLSTMYEGPGQSQLISRLLNTPISSITNFLDAFDCHFKMFYDPRDGHEEDNRVKEEGEQFMRLLSRADLKEALGINTGGKGIEIRAASHQEFGLQMADFAAGEVRKFFRANPDVLCVGSGNDLVTPETDDERPCYAEINGRQTKIGRLIPIPPEIQKRFLKATEQVILPYCRNMIASGSLSCYTGFGQERIVRLFQGLFFDLCD
jgi:hypothetical protein